MRPEYRQLLDLLYLQGYTQTEAAEVMQIPLGTAKTWARQALAKLIKSSSDER